MPTTATLARRLLPLLAGPRHLAATVALAFGITAVGLLAVPAPALAWDAGSFSANSESDLVALQNRARASAGLRSLKVDSTLRSIARWRSKDMIERDYFSHTIKGSNNKVFDVLDRKGYCYRVAGENIGWNNHPDGQATAAIFNMFMDSSGHRANILGKAWDVVGVGAYKGADGKKMWTVIFADRCGSTTKATPKPTPKPTAKPKPKPTPKATPRPTPKPTRKPKPTPAATPELASVAPSDEPSGTPFASASPSPVPTPEPTVRPRPTPRANPDPPANGLRVVDPPAGQGLVDAIVDSVAARFFGD